MPHIPCGSFGQARHPTVMQVWFVTGTPARKPVAIDVESGKPPSPPSSEPMRLFALAFVGEPQVGAEPGIQPPLGGSISGRG